MGSKSSSIGAIGAVAGGIIGSVVPGVGTAIGASIGAGLGGAAGMTVGAQMDATKAAKKAASQQEQQAQNLIKEQENAVAAEKEKANAVRRSAFANKSQTTYSTALGEYTSDVSANVRKKTLLGG